MRKLLEGFTVVELVIVIAVISVLVTVAVPSLVSWMKYQQVSGTVQELLSALQLAQSKTLASENASQYGVYFDSIDSPNRYIVFKGSSYAARDTSYDQIHSLDSSVKISSINLTNGTGQVVFDRFTGLPDESGNMQLSSLSDATQQQAIYVANSGAVSTTAPSGASDSNRTKDSRHVLVDYSRAINTSSETITLTYNGNVTQQIPIASNMNNGEIDWQGTVTVNGVGQTIEIATTRLNNPDTQFDIHRERDVNTVSLKASISGDGTGDIIDYSADGSSVSSGSIYSSNIVWQ